MSTRGTPPSNTEMDAVPVALVPTNGSSSVRVIPSSLTPCTEYVLVVLDDASILMRLPG